MLPVITLVVYVLAIARVTRLVTTDKLSERLRTAVIRWAYVRKYPACRIGTRGMRAEALRLMVNTGEQPMLAYLITCRWCMSIWVAAAATPLIVWYGTSRPLFWVAFALAASHLTGLLAKLEG